MEFSKDWCWLPAHHGGWNGRREQWLWIAARGLTSGDRHHHPMGLVSVSDTKQKLSWPSGRMGAAQIEWRRQTFWWRTSRQLTDRPLAHAQWRTEAEWRISWLCPQDKRHNSLYTDRFLCSRCCMHISTRNSYGIPPCIRPTIKYHTQIRQVSHHCTREEGAGAVAKSILFPLCLPFLALTNCKPWCMPFKIQCREI